ncbi:hypothetical protein BO94DRAFT_505829 [Aspergillus sclerotioniger CBS 115572]|uniref:Uncharacterized protein n=1 Tax=Aspergillus sclerotioniger CBS 115572 TaxID=1450535 RepID=A0A317XDW2_9EURO|nr:hypothetical protein BO94DRAFT_505829 [Aspergillus sclerotioniger CBS 115572]PWY96515.1 hypothetical protein BO94DRAFT_505829 [Aspergillus sclerotioniger CBS 115572]
MAADQLLQSIGHSTPSEEWFDFDNSFDVPYGGLGSHPTSVDSVSPKDLDLTFADFDDCNWGPNPGVCGQDLFADIVNYDAPCEGYVGHALDASQPMLDPTGSFLTLPPAPSQGLIGSGLGDSWLQDMGSADDQFYASVRQMVELQAAADPGALSIKEKRMEASIAIHLQRLQEAALQDLEMSSNSSTTFPSPRWSESAGSVSQGGTCATPVTSPPSETARTPASNPEPAVGGMELVLDLNMNTTTNLPRKQKPRSQAQKENYIKARKYGACEKHRKQHKRCNCLEKAASHAILSQQAVSTADMAVKSTVNAQLHIHRPGNEQLLLRTIPASANKSPVSQPTGGLGPREDQSVQLRHPTRVSCTSSSMDPRYGHHSPRSVRPIASCQSTVGCPNTGQPTPRSPVSWRSADLVNSTPGRLQTSSTSSQPDQKSHAATHGRRHVQAPGRLRTVQAVSTRWRASVETSVLSTPNASVDAIAIPRSSSLVHASTIRSRPNDNHAERGNRTVYETFKQLWSPQPGDQAMSTRHVATHRFLDVPANDVHDQSVSRTIVWRVLQSVFPVSRFLELSIFFASRLSSCFGRSGGFSRFGKSVMISFNKHWLMGKGMSWC